MCPTVHQLYLAFRYRSLGPYPACPKPSLSALSWTLNYFFYSVYCYESTWL